jgi:hypothetical protein
MGCTGSRAKQEKVCEIFLRKERLEDKKKSLFGNAPQHTQKKYIFALPKY